MTQALEEAFTRLSSTFSNSKRASSTYQGTPSSLLVHT